MNQQKLLGARRTVFLGHKLRWVRISPKLPFARVPNHSDTQLDSECGT